MFWLWLSLAVLIITALPFFRFIAKRIFLFLKIRGFCKKNGFEYYGAHGFWLLSNRNGKKYDLVIETPDIRYNIKLFGVFRKNTKLVVKENGDYFIRRYYTFLSTRSSAILFNDGKPKPFASCSFDCECDKKTICNMLLVNPIPIEFLHQPHHGSEIIIDPGDNLLGVKIHSLKSFLKHLNASFQKKSV